MPVEHLTLNNFRCFDRLDVPLHPKLTIVSGKNGSGKTSIVEALFFLGRGRSFRSRNPKTLIHAGEPSFQIIAKDDVGIVGVERGAQDVTRIYGEAAHRSSDLSKVRPVLFIGPDIHGLVDAGPSARRRFLDWGVFHVEHNYHAAWTRFQRALKQRNELLRRGQSISMISAWDAELINNAELLDQYRKTYFAKFQTLFDELLPQALPNFGVEVSYHRGWGGEQSYADTLIQNGDRDRQRRMTLYGPHRADLVLKVNGHSVTSIFSRGQQKLLACMLVIAQGRLTSEFSSVLSTIMVDDLGAELDSGSQEIILQQLGESNAQLVLTTIDPQFEINEGTHLCVSRETQAQPPSLSVIS